MFNRQQKYDWWQKQQEICQYMWIYEAHILLYIFFNFLNYIRTSFNCLIGSSLLANNSNILRISIVLSQIKEVLLYLVNKPVCLTT